jgi:hypothetical protein
MGTLAIAQISDSIGASPVVTFPNKTEVVARREENSETESLLRSGP